MPRLGSIVCLVVTLIGCVDLGRPASLGEEQTKGPDAAQAFTDAAVVQADAMPLPSRMDVRVVAEADAVSASPRDAAHPVDAAMATATADARPDVSPPPAGRLAVTVESVTPPVNLTSEGARDWVHWTRPMETNRKRGVALQIGNYHPVGTIEPRVSDTPSAVSFNWSDGTPTQITSGLEDNFYVTGRNNGSSSRCRPAGPRER